MGRNKKDVTQDVLNLYYQMQEEETVENGKAEINAAIEEIGLICKWEDEKGVNACF